MITKRIDPKNIKIILFVSILSLFVAAVNSKVVYAGNIAIIVNKNNSENIDVNKLTRIFTKDYRIWENGKDIIPVDLKSDNNIYEKFYEKVTGKDSKAIRSYWIQQRITKNIKEPISFETVNKVKEFVQKMDNGIGYIPKADADASVKVIMEVD